MRAIAPFVFNRQSSPLRKVQVFYALIAFCLLLPYLVPVAPSIGLSYVTQFNNRVFVLAFAAGAIAFAVWIRGNTGPSLPGKQGRTLSWLSLVLGCGVYTVLVVARLVPTDVHRPGIEAAYALDRVRLFFHGEVPYREFEYAYGPLHLYVPWLLHRIANLSSTNSYYGWWALQWIGGAAMVWYCIRRLPFPLPGREVLFWSYLTHMTGGLYQEGTAYAPTRMCGSCFLLLLIHHCWAKFRNAWTTSLAALLAIAFAFGISAEQGFGVCAGLLVWFCVLAWKKPATFSRWAVLFFLAMAITMLFAFAHFGCFVTLSAFSSGAYSFPITFSIPILVVLTLYGLVPCAILPVLRDRDWESVLLPLGVGGFALLPAAFGRADLGHILIASPALLLGVGYVQSQRVLRPYWLTAISLLLLVPLAFGFTQGFLQAGDKLVQTSMKHPDALPATVQAVSPVSSAPLLNAAADAVPPPAAQAPIKLILTSPCPETYISVLDQPLTPSAIADQQSCIRETYFRGLINAFTPAALERILQDLRDHPDVPLLLPDQPLATVMAPIEDDPLSLLQFQSALYVPSVRKPPLAYDTIREYITTHYIPAERTTDGQRIWRSRPR